MNQIRIVAAMLPLALVLLTGCGPSGPKKVAVEGAVTLDGQPLTEGTITFIPKGEGNGGSGEIKDGNFKLDEDRGLVPAEYKVEVLASKKTGKKVPGAGPDGMTDEVVSLIPAKYNLKTELTATIKDEPEALSFDLKSK